ncbi:DUF6197 family protein [Actinomadura litoris]|uniref:Uncharacterized protein n=1 Tax=Actinomadura litoris TaxID=2678616 RepID=A0A7K1LAQ4_9ACTN|nr:hypothetical protein [Actinomadura litoris]MUN41498.1 hypothetical protein [Actinomadura litoris]
MSDTQLTAPQILTKAADILTVQGWTQNGDYDHRPDRTSERCPVDLAAALALAVGVDMHSYAAHVPMGVHAAAVRTLGRTVLGDVLGSPTIGRLLDELTDWQDEPGRTVEEVVGKLRAATDDEVRALLEAIHDAIDLPGAATSEGVPTRDRLLDARADAVAAALEALREHGDMGASAAHIRKKIAARPVTYRVYEDGGAV